jgi:hypothetical protein
MRRAIRLLWLLPVLAWGYPAPEPMEEDAWVAVNAGYRWRDTPNQILQAVGDTTREDFAPKVTLKRFMDQRGAAEAQFRLCPDDSDFVETRSGDTQVVYRAMYSTNIRQRIYMIDSSTLEWEVRMTGRPDTNVLTFYFDLGDSLEATYQPQLTPAEEDSGYFRPDSVAGSYAVYRKGWSGIHRVGEGPDSVENYGTGKAFHIYRPKLIDASGEEIWAGMTLDTTNDSISFLLPQDWLDSASYPVVLDPTIGYTGPGASYVTLTGAVAGVGAGLYYTPSVSGDQISRIYVSASANGGGGGGMAGFDSTAYETSGYDAFLNEQTYVMPESCAYIATAGDYISYLRIATLAIKTIQLAVYNYNTTTDLPTSLFFCDTLSCDSAEAWYSITGLHVSLVAGNAYSLSFRHYAEWATGNNSLVKRFGSSTNAIAYASSIRGTIDADWSVGGNTYSTSKVCLIAGIANDGASASAPVAVYSGTGTAQIATATITGIAATKAWYSVATSAGLSSGITYWLAASGSSGTLNLYYDTGTGDNTSVQVSSTLGVPWVHGSYSTRKYSIYADYTAAPSGPRDNLVIGPTVLGPAVYGPTDNVP